MERKIDVTNKAVAEILSKTTEYLQPNPGKVRRCLEILLLFIYCHRHIGEGPSETARQALKPKDVPALHLALGTDRQLGSFQVHREPATLVVVHSNQATHLAVSLQITADELGPDTRLCVFSVQGNAMIEVGETLKLMAEVKDSLDINVKQTFIDPLQLLQDKDLKEIGHHLRKMEGRRLDYDYKKKRVGKVPDEEVRQAVEKFEESKELAERSMFNFLENDVEQVSQLAVFIEAALDYHRQTMEILQELQNRLQIRISAASSIPRREYKPRPVKRSSSELNGVSTSAAAKASGSNIPMDQPCCRGLYDFEPENQGELGFKEGDIITLTNQIDENWYEGMIHGESGFFPINYVEVIVPLPQ
nr:endophilin-A3 [Microcebus murinus]